MPVHQINVNPPDRQPPLSLGPSNNNSPAGGEGLPEWTPRVIRFAYMFRFNVSSISIQLLIISRSFEIISYGKKHKEINAKLKFVFYRN